MDSGYRNGNAVPTRLARKLTLPDAIFIGMGAMIGAGIFAVVGPAAQIAGNGLLPALVVAAVVAFCNATSSAQLASLYPEAGGTYVYGRKKLGNYWGFRAGWGFVTGKIASCAAMALTLASYAFPQFMRPFAIAAVLSLTAVNYCGVKKTALLTKFIVVLVLAALVTVVFAVLAGGTIAVDRLAPQGWSAYRTLQAGGLWFFAFAGYARLATLGEEVVNPKVTIPRAIPIALGITLLLYLTIAITAVLALDIQELANASAPLAAAVEAGSYSRLSPAVRIGAAIASLGVLLSLIAGVSRTLFAMASQRDLPQFFAAVHPRYRIPHHAELGIGILIVALVALVDLHSAIGFSSFTVLAYYAITNTAALRLQQSERHWPRWIALLGVCGCVLLAFSLPLRSIIAGVIVLAAGTLVFVLHKRLDSNKRD